MIHVMGFCYKTDIYYKMKALDFLYLTLVVNLYYDK